MAKTLSNLKSDKDLRSYVREFVKAFHGAMAESDADAKKIIASGRFSLFSGGVVDLNNDVTENLTRLSLRAAKLLGPKAGGEKTIKDIAIKKFKVAF